MDSAPGQQATQRRKSRCQAACECSFRDVPQAIESLKRKRQAEQASAARRSNGQSTNSVSGVTSSSNLSDSRDACEPPPAKIARGGGGVTSSSAAEGGTSHVTTSSTHSALPAEFFDKSISDADHEQPAEETDTQPDSGADSGVLPKGFFDNKLEDAKARHEPYKHPDAQLDEEYAKFQRVIAAETYRAANELDEELEDVQVERTVSEIDEQMSSWAKIDAMQKRAELLLAERSKKGVRPEQVTDDSDDEPDEQEPDVFGDWRRKKVIKK